MSEYVEVTTQAELDKAVADGNIPICRNGFFSAYGSSTVHASGSSTVQAYDSSTVHAYDSSTVHAYGSSTVHASGSSTVHAYGFVAVHRFGTTSKVTGGVLIQVPECKTADEWIAYYGLKVSRGSVVLFKAVDDAFLSGHYANYTPGTTVTAPDFDPHTGCGNGLHFSPRPFMARRYNSLATKYVACRVKVADIIVIDSYGGPSDKVKARTCRALHECTEDGDKVTLAVAA